MYLDKHCRTIPLVNAIAPQKPESTRSKNALLIVVCLAQFMVILDVAIVNVALPSMRAGLHFSTTGLQWVVNAYTLTFAGFLMLGGRLADLLGRRRVFLVGTAMFALSSLGCALADSRDLLIAARGIQGLSGAVLSPATLSIITASFAEGRERNRGLAAWGGRRRTRRLLGRAARRDPHPDIRMAGDLRRERAARDRRGRARLTSDPPDRAR